MNCDYFERCLYVRDRTIKEYEESDDLRRLLYQFLQNYKWNDKAKVNTVEILNDAFYLVARLYVDDYPEEEMILKYIDFYTEYNRQYWKERGTILSDADSDRVERNNTRVLLVMFTILSLQKNLSNEIQDFLCIFKSFLKEDVHFMDFENIAKKWKSDYGLFCTDLTPNPSLEVIKNIYAMARTESRTEYIIAIDKLDFAFYYAGLGKYIKFHKSIEEQHAFVNFAYNECMGFFKETKGNLKAIDFEVANERKAMYDYEIERGVYLQYCDFASEGIRNDGTYYSQLTPSKVQLLRKRLLLLEDTLGKRDAEIEQLCQKFKDYQDSTKKDSAELFENLIAIQKERTRLENELKALKEATATGNPKQCVSLQKIKKRLIDLNDYDDAKRFINYLNEMRLFADDEWEKVEQAIRNHYQKQEEKKNVAVVQQITQSNVFNGEVNDPTFK